MGTTFSTIQIQNQRQPDSNTFIKTFTKHMEKKGLIAATHESAQLSFYIAFSDTSNWITLSSPEYDIGSDSFKAEVQGLAKALKTCCIGTSVFDSDIVSLELFNYINKQEDTVLLGRVDGLYDMPETELEQAKGNPECWKPLLAKDRTWEELASIWNTEYLFEEEVLAKMAPLLNMDAQNIAADYHYWNEIDPDNTRLIRLYFTTSEPEFITDGATKLAFYFGANLVSSIENIMTFYNIGGVSKGLSVMIYGDCFKNNEVEINALRIERPKNPRIGRHGQTDRDCFTAALEKANPLPNGQHGVAAHFFDYEFCEGINMGHPSMKVEKYINAVLAFSSTIFITATILSGEKHELSVYVIPHSNWMEGQACSTADLCKA